MQNSKNGNNCKFKAWMAGFWCEMPMCGEKIRIFIKKSKNLKKLIKNSLFFCVEKIVLFFVQGKQKIVGLTCAAKVLSEKCLSLENG